jgi:hypothetical protein
VANFGPQTGQAAILEVEAKPVLASPSGTGGMMTMRMRARRRSKEGTQAVQRGRGARCFIVVMTNTKFSGLEMATIAQEKSRLLHFYLSMWTVLCVFTGSLPEGSDKD